MTVLGISLGHDTNFALVEDGRLVAAVEAERFFRQKRYKLHCLDLEPGKRPSGFQYVDVAELEQFLIDLGERWGKGFARIAVQNQGRTKEVANLRILLDRLGFMYGSLDAVDHHLSHAALGFYTSPFAEALVFSYDGFGNDGNTVLFRASGETGIDYLARDETRFGQSYNNLGYIVGIKPEVCGTSAGKTMGLAGYGRVHEEWLPFARRYVGEYRKLPQPGANGIAPYGVGHRINSQALDGIAELRPYLVASRDGGWSTLSDMLVGLLTGRRRRMDLRLPGPESREAQDLVATVQAMWTERALGILERHRETSRNLCVVGGCGLNGITNDAILRSGKFESVHFVPNPTDCGLAGGAALYAAWRGGNWRFAGSGEYLSPYLGLEPFDAGSLPRFKREYPSREFDPAETPAALARLLGEDRLVGVIRGRYEVGPRALGNRSILCNPLNPDMRDILNKRVKHREWFRPFAPVATAEDAPTFFTNVADIPYMSVICHTRPEYRERLPSVTHVDGTCRLQTVRRQQNPFLYDTLRAFEALSGVPILLNTSFNPRGEPILNYLSVGLEMLTSTELDYVLFENTLFTKPGRGEMLFPSAAVEQHA